MSELHPNSRLSMTVPDDRPLIGVPVRENGRDAVRYYTDEEDADQAVSDQAIQDALSLAGAWDDLDWNEMAVELDRIRHESEPTPPIEDLPL